MINPPYVYGYLPGAKDKSAALWCQVLEGDQKRYFLLVMLKADNTHESAQCPARIRWNNPPGGLDVYSNPRESLGDFVFLDQPNQKGPRNANLTHNAIRSEYDGAAEILYCYKGKWLIRWRH